ncbi:MAG: hypothetical protein HY876_05555 [Coriobacteriales bacterium]|nr:hypothetical protein [Coriobacteriales bacterium]
MKTRDLLTRILAVVGTAMVALPLVAPLALTAVLAIQTGTFRLDWLMPAELGLSAFGGAFLLVWAAFRADSHKALIGGGLGVALAAIIAASVLAQVTGLASGETEPGGLPFALVIGAYIVYAAALVELLVAGVLLTIDVFRHGGEAAPPALPVT